VIFLLALIASALARSNVSPRAKQTAMSLYGLLEGFPIEVWTANIITNRESVMGKFRFRGTGNNISFGWGKVMLRVELLVLVLMVIVWLLWSMCLF
jgi:hypothetical protein